MEGVLSTRKYSDLTNTEGSRIPIKKSRVASTPVAVLSDAEQRPMLRTPPQLRSVSTNTPPSTMSKLTANFASLSLNTPTPSPLKQATNVQESMGSAKRHSKLAIPPTLKESDPRLESRTSSLLKSRMKEPTPLKTTPRIVTSRSRSNLSTPPVRNPSVTRSISSNRLVRDSSPLLDRLTRTTTSQNLKVRSLRVASDTNHGIPRQQVPKQRVISEIPESARSTKSSRLKKEASMMNLSLRNGNLDQQKHHSPNEHKLVVQKKRLPKSFSVNASLKDLTNSSISTARLPNTTRSLRQPLGDPPQVRRKNEASRWKSSSSSNGTTESSRSDYTQSTSSYEPATLSPKCNSAAELFELLKKLPVSKYHDLTRDHVLSWDDDSDISNTLECTPGEALSGSFIGAYEKKEIETLDKVYYFKRNIVRPKLLDSYRSNFGLDDKDNCLVVADGDHINYRFQILSKLGAGAFGVVYKCFDHKERRVLSLKIMRNEPRWALQCVAELKMLRLMKDKSPYLLQIDDCFHFRSHFCITTELLWIDLYQAIAATHERGFDMEVVKMWARQLLSGLDYMHSQNIIHADLKPENIMICSPDSLDVKIIDFGAATYTNNLIFPYIQSRFYRAPEVLLGARYDTKIDIWSFGCLIFESAMGDVMFAASSEEKLFKHIAGTIGYPTTKTIMKYRQEILKSGSVNLLHDRDNVNMTAMLYTKFDRLGRYRPSLSDPDVQRDNIQRRVEYDEEFGNFLSEIFVWDNTERPSTAKLLQHEFLR